MGVIFHVLCVCCARRVRAFVILWWRARLFSNVPTNEQVDEHPPWEEMVL
jgi:hypothetical protein